MGWVSDGIATHGIQVENVFKLKTHGHVEDSVTVAPVEFGIRPQNKKGRQESSPAVLFLC
jgi:hypothetical protein